MTTETLPSEPLYRLRDVRRVYTLASGDVHAVDGVSLDINAGEFVAIEGPSGSGKTTMLQLLGALDRATDGTVELDGKHLHEMDDAALTQVRAETIGFVFQHFNLIPTLSALENVEMAMVPMGLDRGARRARATELLDKVGLAARGEHLPSLLSGGEQQRVAIARALANHPRVLLADEPTGNLDSVTSAEVVETLARLVTDEGVTVIMVTHGEDVAGRAARRIKMRDGKAIDDSPVKRARRPAKFRS